jgi:Ku70/Ku80 beta-barrel domain
MLRACVAAKICKLEEKPVPEKEIVKAFEYHKGEYVYMEDEDFEAARAEGYKTIEITDSGRMSTGRHALVAPLRHACPELERAPITTSAAGPR